MANFSFAFGVLPSTLVTVDPAFLGKRPTINYMAFITVFKPSAWLVVMAFASVCCLIYVFYFKTTGNSEFSQLFLTSMAFAYDLILKLGNLAFGSRFSGKLTYIILSLFATVTMAYYEGMLTSFMTAGEPQTKIRSFADLIDSNYQLIFSKGTIHDAELSSAPLGSGKKRAHEHMISRFGDNVYVPTLDMKAAMLENPDMIAYSTVMAFLGDTRFLPLNIDDQVNYQSAFAFPPGSELLELFNYNMVWYHQSGVQVRQDITST